MVWLVLPSQKVAADLIWESDNWRDSPQAEGAGMDVAATADGADRFVACVEALTRVIGHADRALPLRDYCAGLLTAEGRKSVEPMAAVTAPAQVSVQHQKLLHFVGEGKWSDDWGAARIIETAG